MAGKLLWMCGLGVFAALPSVALAAAPTVSAVSATTAEDTASAITLVGSDADGHAITYSIQTNPSHGTVSISGSRATYTPTANWYGVDTFRYKATDSTGASSTAATVTVTVTSVNDTPTAASQSVSTSEDTARTITLSASDADGDSLSYSISSAPSYGSAALSRGVVTYTPLSNWSGTDSFRFVALDSRGATSAAATVTITVTAVNDPPTANDQSFTIAENTSQAVTLTASDPDSTAVTMAIAASPRNGRVTLVGRTATYTPNTNFTGSDSFTFTASDGTSSDTGTVRFTVTAANSAPTATAVTATTNEDTATSFTLTASDPDGDAMTYSVVTNPSNGRVTLSGNRATYTPNANWSGTDRFSWRVSDGALSSSVVNASITVNPVNDPPVATAQSLSTPEDAPLAIRLSSTDVDARTARTYAISTQPTHGTVILLGANATYTPDVEFTGTDTFRFTASDGSSTSSPATITINVTGVDDAPVGYHTIGQTYQGTGVVLENPWYDPDDETGTITLVSNPSHGRVTTTAAGFRYTPNLSFHGVDRFTWTVTTNGQTSAITTTQINVHPASPLARPEMPQIGLNKIQFGLGADPGDWTTAEPQFQPEAIFDDFADLGVQIFRQMTRGDLVWSTLELGPGNFQDVDADAVVTTGLFEPTTTLFEIQYASPTPPYCEAGEPFQKTMGDDAYTYLDHVIEHYADWVSSYEIGNEMYHWIAVESGGGGSSGASELPDCLPSDGYSPAEQAVFIEEASRYMKDGDPDALITLASVNTDSPSSNDWLTEVVETAGSDWFDVVSYHSYDSWQRAYNTRDNLGELLSELGLDEKLVRLTEEGTTSSEDYTDRTDYPNSDETQCADIFRLTLIGWGEGDASVIWHTYLPVTDAPTGEFQGFNIVEYDGTWKPSAYAFQLLTQNLVPFQQVTDISRNGKYMYRILTTDSEVRYVVWGTGDFEVPGDVTEYTSVVPAADNTYDWTPVSAGALVELDELPLLFR